MKIDPLNIFSPDEKKNATEIMTCFRYEQPEGYNTTDTEENVKVADRKPF